MTHKNIRIPTQNAHDIMEKLGSIDNSLEFVDLNQELIETKKPYNKMISRCDELEKAFIKFDTVIQGRNITYEQYKNFELFHAHLEKDISNRDKVSGSTYFDLVENEVLEDGKRMGEQIKLIEDNKEDYMKLLENHIILEKLDEMFDKGTILKMGNNNEIVTKKIDEENDTGINYISGICNTIDEIKVKRLVFRSSRGRAIPTFFNINLKGKKDKYFENKFREKKMFLILVQGTYLLNKINGILKIFNCSTYDIPNPDEVKPSLYKIESDLSNKEKLIKEGEITFINFLKTKTEKSNGLLSLYGLYRAYFKREKCIYLNLNKCIAKGNFITGEVWIPECTFNIIQTELQKMAEQNDQILLPEFSDLDIDTQPPTFFKINEFTYAFQEVVNTYGIPRYKEANPGIFSIVSFPFLFGVMFGDIGHGTLIFILASYMCLNKNNIMQGESLLKQGLKYRYFLLLMGFFSLFCGLMYNDMMALPLSFFNSCYETNYQTYETIRKPNCVYPVGIDPKWYSATNDLSFLNSFKMKWSVIIGVIQMMLGIVLRGMNNIYFKDYSGFIFEAIPQIIFMSLLFGYMIVLIFIKWSKDWSLDYSKAPSIISILMGIALNGGSVDGKPIWGEVSVEEKTNRTFLYICICCVPIILIPKPIIRIISNNKENKNKLNNINDKISDASEPLLEREEIEIRIKKKEIKHETATDIFVHQIIETIEFVLGCVSNTASYLRLWALSLAHAQLSKVFFEKALLGFAQNCNLILVIIGYFVFANVTVSVLMGMDLLESFLHTLRLHWVEFQNKFYAADGVKYVPFSFRDIIEEE